MRLLTLLILALTASAQTTVYLRYGTPGGHAVITNCTNDTPIVCTSNSHGFSNDDLIYVQGVYGNWAANGQRKVKNVATNTFELYTQADVAVAGNGAWASSPSARAGRVQAHTLVARPRMMLDGPGGSWTTKFADPSVKTVDGWIPWEALQYVNDRDEGVTGYSDYRPDIAYRLALGWFMDNSRTSWRTNAVRLLNDFENCWGVGSTTSYNPCPGIFAASSIGRGSGVDWPSAAVLGFLFAYDLVRDYMTSDERAAFRGKVLNNQDDFGETCTNNITEQTGRVSTVVGTKVVTGTGTDLTTIAPGTLVLLLYRTTSVWSTRYLYTKVVSVESATSMTVEHNAPYTESNVILSAIRPWQAGDCGFRWLMRTHENAPQQGMDRRRFTFTNTAPIGANDTTITVSAAPPKVYPYYIRTDLGAALEYIKVTGAVGNVLTVERGYLNTTPTAWTTGRTFSVADPDLAFKFGGATPTLTVDGMIWDGSQSNLTLQKLLGSFAVGFALADEDERARKHLEDTFNYYYDYVLPFNKRSWTGFTQSANESGYNVRQHGQNLQIAWMLKNSLSPSVDLTGGEWLKAHIMTTPKMQLPGWNQNVMPFSDTRRSFFEWRYAQNGLLASALFPTSTEARQFDWWYKTKMNRWVLTNFYAGDHSSTLTNTLFLPSPSETEIVPINFEATNIPDFVFDTVDQDDALSTPVGGWYSKTDWTDTATGVFAMAVSYGVDHTGSYPGPGAYKITKGQVFLAGDTGTYASDTGGFRQNSNFMRVRPELGNETYNGATGARIDKYMAAAGFGYVRIRNSGAYQSQYGVTRAHRHMLHVKGDADVIVAYDNVVTSSAYTRRLNFHTYADGNETPTWSRTDCKAIHTRPTANARLVVQFVGSGFTCSETLPAIAAGNTYNRLVADFPASTTGGMFTVSKAFTGTSGDVADIAAIGTISSSHEGVEIPSLAVVAAMPKNGTATSTSLTYTTAAAATHYVGGMTAGEYVVSVGGDAVSPNPTVDGENLLVFTSASTGAVSIVKTDATAPLEITTASIANPQVGVAYSTTLAGSGGTPPYSWSATGVPAGLSLSSAGVLSGTPTTAGPYTIAVTLTDDVSATANRNIAVTVSAETPPSITLSLSPLTLTFVGSEGGANPANQTLTFTSDYATSNWSRAITDTGDGTSWLTVTPASGTTAANLTVAVNTAALTVGTYCADVVVSSTDPAVTNSPRTSRACVNVLAALTPPEVEYPASMRVTLGSVVDLNFTVEAGTGTGDITWTISGDMPFGVTFADNGDGTATISGTARDIGRWPFTITATDENDETGEFTGAVEVVLPTEATGIELTPKTFGGGVVLIMRKPGLDANLNCRSVLRVDPGTADPTTYVQDNTIKRGPAVRKFYFSGVSAGNYLVEVMCRIGDGIATPIYYTRRIPVTIPADAGGDGTYSVAFKPPAGRGITHARLRYRLPEGSFTNTTPVACTDAAECILTITATKGLYEVQRQQCSNSDCSTVVLSSSITEQIVQ